MNRANRRPKCSTESFSPMKKTTRSPAASRVGVWIGCHREWRCWHGGVGQHPRTIQVKAIAAYRVRKAPRDVTRLCWFALRGHGRWITKAWTYTTHGDLRADARAARLAGDQEARRTAQETIRADSRARWAKVGLALRRGLG